MKKQDDFNIQNGVYEDDGISLNDIVKPLWHSRWAILLISVLVGAFSLFVSLSNTQYKSEGFFQFAKAIPLVDYKRYAAAYVSSGRFADFVQGNKLPMTDDLVALKNQVASREVMDKRVEPVYPFTRFDAKTLLTQGKNESNDIIGLSINYSGSTPEKAQQMVGLLGRYVIDSIAYQDYSDKVRFKSAEIRQEIVKFDSAIIALNEQLENFRRRGVDLKQIVSRYPESARQAATQVISVTEDNARYLSPITLLATTEVQASEAKEQIHKIKRKQQQDVLLLEYYDRVEELMDKVRSGEGVLLGLEPIKEGVFKSKNLEDDVVREAYNMITIENRDASNLYLKKSRFISGPTLPPRSQAKPLKELGIGLVLGLCLSVLVVFVRNWWRDNRSRIVD